MEKKKSYTYIVKCSDGTLYTGWTTCLEHRIAAHNNGKGAKYTRSRRPVELVYYESFDTKQKAMQREAAIKRMKRGEKEQLMFIFTGRGTNIQALSAESNLMKKSKIFENND